MTRESMEFDLVVVGAGPSGLAAAIRAKQLDPDLAICVVEKGSEVGAHLLSGAIFEPQVLDDLLPDWRESGAPLATKAREDSFFFLTETKAFGLPVPPSMHNEGNYIISLGNLCRWLATRAEALGIDIFPGFAAAEVLYDQDGMVVGIATGDMGIGKDGQPTANYAPGIDLRARQTIIAEGCRGSLAESLISKFDLRKDCDPQTYALGIKELWEIDPAKHSPGRIVHGVGWPMTPDSYGGSFVYHLEDNQISIGMVIGLGYANPFLSPFDEFQRFKTHPTIRPLLEGGRRIAYGARAIAAGGIQSLPKLTFPGGVLVGDSAGFLNLPKIKGNHAAMRSGMLAAEAVVDALKGKGAEAISYPTNFQASPLHRELVLARNIKPSFSWGLYAAMAYSGLDTYVLRGRAPWTLHHKADHSKLKAAAECRPIAYSKPDGVIGFDKPSSVYLSNANHEENQPCHLRLKAPSIPIAVNLPLYDSPEQRYCPAGVYEIVTEAAGPRLQINAQNCLHCKTCDIKDPTQNITWTVPEGGGGPNYPNM